MNKLMKPERLALDPNSSSAAKEWRHWKRTFENYIESFPARREGEPEINKLRILTNCVDFKVFDFIEDSATYDAAIEVLNELYVKTPNAIFARHLLATAKQQSGQTLDEFMQVLRTLSKDCDFHQVSADQYRKEMIRDAFINGLSSSVIRQRLLENRELSLEDAITKASALDRAQRNSQAYDNPTAPHVLSVSRNEQSRFGSQNQQPRVADQALQIQRLPPTAVRHNSNSASKSCFYCGSATLHGKNSCPARSATCFSCQKKGHFAIVCKSRPRQENVTSTIEDTQTLCAIHTAPSCLSHATMTSYIEGRELSTIIDSGSSLSFINDLTARSLGLQIHPSTANVSMAMSTLQGKVLGQCSPDLTINGKAYNGVKLGVLKNLCSDVLLGSDFQSQHQRVIFEYNGQKPDFIVENTIDCCAVSACSVEPVQLFSNLIPNCRPIATKSRRYDDNELEFIRKEVKRLHSKKIIQPSESPWRAQVLVVKNEETGKRRLCVDYSQTINLYTLLDAYPLPRIEDLVNNLAAYKVFSTFDLKSAYHQVEIQEVDKPYTAFEAVGRLWEFNRIPFGVTNGVPKFQRIIDQIVDEDGLKDTYPYLDNVTVGGRDQHEHDENVKRFLDAISKRNLTLNEEKTVASVSEINILGYCVGNCIVKPDSERLRPLRELPAPHNTKSLKRALGLFAYYAKWVHGFSDKIKHLKNLESFPLQPEALKDFENLKNDIANAALTAIDENLPFVVECDASDIAISATLNQAGRPVAFMSRTLQAGERHYPAIEKEATAVIEAVRKWKHFLARRPFTLITDQKSVAFMLDNRKRTKIKNNKIQCWRLELASLSYTIQYRPGKENVGPDTFTRAFCASSFSYNLQQIHDNLCHPGISRLSHFVRSKNLPFSMEDVKKVCLSCKICCELKPRFFKAPANTLIKATRPFERISIDFKGPLPSCTRNFYLLVVIDEYSRFPFCFPCPNMYTSTVMKCLDELFSLCGVPGCILSDNARTFTSNEFKTFLLERGIASSHSTVYHPTGNSQVERYNGVIWRAIRLALKSRNLPINQWERVLPYVLHSLRSLLCTSTNATPHELFFSFHRKSSYGVSLPAWLTKSGPVLLRKFVRDGKNDDLVRLVELTDVNPTYARVRFPDGRESSVSLQDLAPVPSSPADDESRLTPTRCDGGSSPSDDFPSISDIPSPVGGGDASVLENTGNDSDLQNESQSPVPAVRRSSRINKGVPPIRYGQPTF